MQEVTAGRGLGDQMMVVQLIEQAAGALQAGVVEGGRGVGVDVRARSQAQPAEQPLLGRGEIGVGQVERGRDRQILRAHDGQPVAGRRQVSGQLSTTAGRVVPQLPAEHPDRQRQVPGQLGYLPGRALPGSQVRPARQPGQQHRRLVGGQSAEADHHGVFQSDQPPAAGDQDQAAGRAGQERPDLLMPGRVIQQQQDLLARDIVTPPARPGLQAGRDVLLGDAGRQQQAGQRVGWANRPLAGSVGVQGKEELPVREARGQLVRGVHRKGRLADPRHPVNHADPWRPSVRGPAGLRSQQPRQLRVAAGKAAHIPGQAPGRCRR